jgi:hypothetical protein
MDCDSEDLNELINVSITPKYLTEEECESLIPSIFEEIIKCNQKTIKIYPVIKNEDNKKILKAITCEKYILEYLRDTELFKPLHKFYKKSGINIESYKTNEYNYHGDSTNEYYEYINHSFSEIWFESKVVEEVYSYSDESEDEELNNSIDCIKKLENKYINRCISEIKEKIKNPEDFVNTYFKHRRIDSKIISEYLYHAQKKLLLEINKLKDKYYGLDPKIFEIKKSISDTYLNFQEYIKNPDTFKCGICLENFTYETTTDYCCMKNYCRECIENIIIMQKKCAICKESIIKQPKKKDTVYIAGSMSIDRPLIEYGCDESTSIFDYRCECCDGCPICHGTMGDCDCNIYDKSVLDYYKNDLFKNILTNIQVNNDNRIYKLIGPIKFIGGKNLNNCSHECDHPCIPPYFGISLINTYRKCIELADIFIMVIDPKKLDGYASFSEWGMASMKKKQLYIIPKYGMEIPTELWWFAMDSMMSLNCLIDKKRIDYHMLIINSINPEIRNTRIYYRMINNTSNKNKEY